MSRVDAYRMVQRRAAALGLRVRIGCHTFRATGITAYLDSSVPISHVIRVFPQGSE